VLSSRPKPLYSRQTPLPPQQEVTLGNIGFTFLTYEVRHVLSGLYFTIYRFHTRLEYSVQYTIETIIENTTISFFVKISNSANSNLKYVKYGAKGLYLVTVAVLSLQGLREAGDCWSLIAGRQSADCSPYRPFFLQFYLFVYLFLVL
jgi:hypothetical protein